MQHRLHTPTDTAPVDISITPAAHRTGQRGPHYGDRSGQHDCAIIFLAEHHCHAFHGCTRIIFRACPDSNGSETGTCKPENHRSTTQTTKPATLNAAFEVIAKDFPVQHLTVDESKNTLNQQTLERHNRERAQIENMFAQSQPRRLWTEAFIQPLQGRLSTPFGVKRFINKQPRNPHSGLDMAAPTGTPVKATAAGVVSLTGEHFFAGKSVYIDHGCDTFSMYFHLDSIAVQDGQTIAGGDIIGHVGATGRATGPHLHWGMRMHGTPIDPFSLLALFEN